MPPEPDPVPSKADYILEAARRLFARYGFRRTAMEDIAREAGVAKGTVYLYFDSKDAVYLAVQARDAAEVLARCDRAAAAHGGFRDRLHAMLDAKFGLFFERYGASEHAAELKALNRTLGREAARTLDEAYARRLTDLIEAAARAGEIDLAASALTSESVVRMAVAGAVGLKYCAEAGADARAYRAKLGELATLIAAAVRGRGAAARRGGAAAPPPPRPPRS
ncbi:MAG: TetR/AcrR family transcriptional regulator, partial [Rhodospirillaceae bacterium]|nr:TetR/AcrR family transcriptional regulator [Rhodospirillaceae bacterium]